MRLVKYFVACSLDSYICRKDGSVDWLFLDQDYGMKEFFASIGYEAGGESPAQFQKTFENDKKRWGEVARLAKVTADE